MAADVLIIRGQVCATHLQGAQEVQQVLPVSYAKQVEVVDHRVGFRTGASVGPDGCGQVLRTAIMEKEDALRESPQRS